MSGDGEPQTTIDAEQVYAVFGDQISDRTRGLAAVTKLAEGVCELIPLMDASDGGGQLRVAAMLLGLSQALAARERARQVQL